MNHQSIEDIFASPAWRSMFDTFKRGEWSIKGPCSRCRSDDAGTILRLVDGVTSNVKDSIRQIPASSFKRSAAARRNPSGHIVTDREAPDGCLFWGPYVRAEHGRYRVFHDLKVLRASEPCAIKFDVCVDFGTVITSKRVELSDDDNFDATIDFEHVAGELLEFRIYKSGNISLEYKGTRLLKL